LGVLDERWTPPCGRATVPPYPVNVDLTQILRTYLVSPYLVARRPPQVPSIAGVTRREGTTTRKPSPETMLYGS
jgi:hypothetical protein